MTGDRLRCWSAGESGIRVAVKVTPRARAVGVGGLAASADGPRLRIAVTEAPEDGRASKAACQALAKALGVAKGRVAVASGEASREKMLFVAEAADEVGARLDQLAEIDR